MTHSPNTRPLMQDTDTECWREQSLALIDKLASVAGGNLKVPSVQRERIERLVRVLRTEVELA